MQVALGKWRGVAAAVAALTAVAVTPSLGVPTPPTDFTYEPTANQLVGLYSGPGIATSSDSVKGSSTSQPTVPNIDVIVIFSGSGWNTSANQLTKFTDLLYLFSAFTGPYFQELKQYGFQNLTYNIQSVTDTSSSALGKSFTDAQVQNDVTTYLHANISIPVGYRPMYLLIPAPGSVNSQYPTAGGEHFTYTAPGNSPTLAAWVLPQIVPGGVLHEVAETITDPVVGKNWQMDRSFNGWEICDAGQAIYDWMPTYQQTASPYWSQLQHACVIPVGTPGQAAGDSMTSYFDGQSTHLFYVGTNNHILELIGTGTSPTYTSDDPLAIANGSTPRGGTGLTSFWDPISLIGHVFYVGKDGDVKELYHLNGGNWLGNDLQVAANPNLPAGDTPETVHKEIDGDRCLTSFFNQDDGTENVFFIDQVPGIEGFKWTGATGWEGASPPEMIDPATHMAIDPEMGTQMSALYNGTTHLFFIDANGHIREFAQNGTTWTNTDWSATIGSSVALPSLDALATSTEYIPGDTLTTDAQVYYIDTNRHIQTITRYSDGTYSSIDLTAGLPSTSLPGSPVLSCTDIGGEAHVFYIGQDSQVHEVVRTEINIFYDTQTWQPMDTPATPFGHPYAMVSRVLTSVYNPYYSVLSYFDLNETVTNPRTNYGVIGAGVELAPDHATLWTPDLPNTVNNFTNGIP